MSPYLEIGAPRVAVIGAGIAGLSCAVALRACGLRVSVYDKARGVGGRTASRRGEHWQGDHGAQYFTAREPVFRAELARWQGAGAAAPWQARLARIDASGATPLAATSVRFVGTPRMTAPAALMAAALGDAAAIALQTPIVAIERAAARWRLHGQDGAIEPLFDAVVLALPADQAAPLLAAPAPALAATAAAVPMQPCWAVMLQFAAPLAIDIDAAFVDTGPLGWIARDNSKPGRHGADNWLLHASAAWSADHLEDDGASVAAALGSAFAALVGASWPHAGAAAAAPSAALAHRWRYARAQAHIAEGAPGWPWSDGCPDGCLWDAGRRIGVCGDWLGAGTVEAAWLSGRALAHRIGGGY